MSEILCKSFEEGPNYGNYQPAVSQIHENSMTGRAYVHGRSADTNLTEIHEEISELLDKFVHCMATHDEPSFSD